VVLLALLARLICPLAETDPGDNVFQTGNDTESGLALLTLCVAATCALARLITVLSGKLSILSCGVLTCCVRPGSLFGITASSSVVASASPPVSALRI
jgi:hypothetical protein